MKNQCDENGNIIIVTQSLEQLSKTKYETKSVVEKLHTETDMYDISRMYKILTRNGMTIEQIIHFMAEKAATVVNKKFIKSWANDAGISVPSDFCMFLLVNHYFEDVVKSYEEVVSLQENNDCYEKEITTGNPVDRDGKVFSWQEYTDSKGGQRYQSKEDWIFATQGVITDNKKSIAMEKESIKEKWEEYAGSADANELMESELISVMEWWNEYKNIVESVESCKMK